MFNLPELYVISGKKFDADKNHIATLEKALKGGAKIIQLREKNLSDIELLEYALKLRQITKKYNSLFIVNDRADIAFLSEADGVHIGQHDLSVKNIKKIIGKNKIVGKSTHSPEQALEAQKEGADYIGVGPVFYTQSKTDVINPVGLEYVRWAAENVKIPFVAIGGIKLKNVEQVIQNGAKSIAVITEIIQSDNAEKKTQELLHRIKKTGVVL